MAAAALACFGAWVRMGGLFLHGDSNGISAASEPCSRDALEALVMLALLHLQNPSSQVNPVLFRNAVIWKGRLDFLR
jgi:hypothetical protein